MVYILLVEQTWFLWIVLESLGSPHKQDMHLRETTEDGSRLTRTAQYKKDTVYLDERVSTRQIEAIEMNMQIDRCR